MKLNIMAAVVGLSVAATSVQAAPVVKFDPDPKAVLVGDTFQLLLQGQGFDLTATNNLVINNVTGGQKFNLQFDQTRLEVVGVSIDSSIWSYTAGNKTGILNNDAGTITGMAFGTFPATTADDFNIATITFKALSAGQAAVNITGGEFAAKVNNVSGVKIVPTFDSGLVHITAVPEPEQWAMMLAGLGLIGVMARKR